MSREIKFRAWDTENKTWTYVTLGDLVCGACTANGDKPLSGAEQIWEQYTEGTDKNGKEIYEGDIVNIQGIKYYVDFEHGGFWFSNGNRKWKAYRPFTHFQEINDAEVVGNIHEPPKDFRPEHLKRMGVSISKGGEE